MKLTVGQTVWTDEHPKAIGTVLRITTTGDAVIQFETPASETLPLGCINTDFWPAAELDRLTIIVA